MATEENLHPDRGVLARFLAPYTPISGRHFVGSDGGGWAAVKSIRKEAAAHGYRSFRVTFFDAEDGWCRVSGSALLDQPIIGENDRVERGIAKDEVFREAAAAGVDFSGQRAQHRRPA